MNELQNTFDRHRLVFGLKTDTPLDVARFKQVISVTSAAFLSCAEDDADDMEFDFLDLDEEHSSAPQRPQFGKNVHANSLYFEVAHLNPSRLPVPHGAPKIQDNAFVVTLMDI